MIGQHPHTPSAAASVWVQGMGTDSKSDDRSWRSTLYLRLTVQHRMLRVGPTTAATELALGWPNHTYFSVNCPFPTFDLRVVIYAGVPADHRGARATPFDSGGMWSKKIKLQSGVPFDDSSRRRLINGHSMTIAQTIAEFPSWVNRSYQETGLYEQGERPKSAYAREVDLGQADDARAWSWEARIPLSEPHTVAPLQVYLSEEDNVAYQEWMDDQLSDADHERHSALLDAILNVSTDPVDSMLADLEIGKFR